VQPLSGDTGPVAGQAGFCLPLTSLVGAYYLRVLSLVDMATNPASHPGPDRRGDPLVGSSSGTADQPQSAPATAGSLHSRLAEKIANKVLELAVDDGSRDLWPKSHRKTRGRRGRAGGDAWLSGDSA
jgi:hypothetical protein